MVHFTTEKSRVKLLLIIHCDSSAQRRGQNNRHRAEQDILASIIKPEVKTNPGGNETRASLFPFQISNNENNSKYVALLK